MTTHGCPCCSAGPCDLFYQVRGLPTSSRPRPTREEAIAVRRGDVALRFCNCCGLVFNAAFDPRPREDASAHEETYSASSTFRAFQHRLAEQLVERYGLHGKDVLEIGCGNGEFLRLVCACGGNNGVGLDPGYAAGPDRARDDRTIFRREAFTENTITGSTDLVCSKMMLDRLADPARFVALLRAAVARREAARLFLQVPDVVRTLEHVAFWEIHCERCCYFSPGTLSRLLRARGFTVGDIWTDFDGQYLMADARADAGGAAAARRAIGEPIADLEQLVARFRGACREKHAMWCELLHEIARAGRRTAIWGAGPKAVSFLTTLAVGDEVGFLVDVNPHRQGKYTPGTGHRIVAPDVMAAARPDVLIVMNSAYAFEIQERVSRTGCAPTLLIA